ncbi:related to amidase [Phialocephala subalpina]|uniref:Related to amidase n=1 Tax=Phialocephala subalpina TaxID=576137 RepID=A0A1L7XCH9_9HELO|nr:related to amidase [Phialocephala subalpina]
MKHRSLRSSVVVLLLLVVGSVSAVLIFRSSNSVEKSEEFPSLINATIEILTEGLACKKFTSVDLVKAYLSRIAEVNETVHAVTEINPDALTIAAKLDLERSAGTIRGPLHGIPILIKNNIATKDKMNNTAGSWALLGATVPRDATVAKKLRAAGAILLGKANLSQWANFRSLDSSNGWSSLGGQVYGPYYPNQDPQGSSSGSAVASAMLGNRDRRFDHISFPAQQPSWHQTKHLVIPISEHEDTVGPLTRTVKDAAYILQAIAGVDTRDNYTSAIPDGTIPNYIAACKLSGLSGLRLGIPRNVIALRTSNTSAPMIEAFEQALDVLEAAGAIIVEDTNFTAAAEYRNSSLPLAVAGADFVVNLQTYLKSLTYNPKNITSLAVLRDFTQSFPLEDYPARDTGLWDQSLQSWNNTDPRFWAAYQQVLYYGGEGGLLGALDRNNLDAVILPARWAPDWASPVGTPIITVPLGSYPSDTPVVKDSWGLVQYAPNIPFGISFLGARFSEEKLIGMAYAFEQRTMVRDKVQPYILPTTELADVVIKKHI